MASKNLNNGGNYKNYLQRSGKTYYLNTAGILPENAISGKIHTYKIGALEKHYLIIIHKLHIILIVD